MKLQLAPQKIISLSALIVLSVFILSSYLAMKAPWMGLELGANPQCVGLCVLEVDDQGAAAGLLNKGDDLIGFAGSDLHLQADDLIEEPDSYALYSEYNDFLARQHEIYIILTQPEVMLQLEDGRAVRITPLPSRPFSELPGLFWYQLICGAIFFLAGMGVLAFRPRELVTILYALTGFGLMLASSSAAIYSTRELAMDGELFYTLSLINQFGTLFFVGPFISILWCYPQRIHRFYFEPVLITIFMFFWVLSLFQLTDSIDVPMRYPVFAGLPVVFLLAVIQWKLSRHKPLQRAILKWFLFAWLSGTTLYIGLHMVPLVLFRDAIISQSLGWGALVTIYLGVALGITRFRLFNLDRWVVIGWFWFLGGVGVIIFDAVLISLLELNNQLSLAITLAIAGWLYFPVKQYLVSYFFSHKNKSDYREMLPNMLFSLLNINRQKLQHEWSQLLHRLFLPLNIESIDLSIEQVQLHPEGVSLSIPGFNDVLGLRLSYADHGNRLFNRNDLYLADAVYQLFCHTQEFRDAFTKGVQEERGRLARDLHDDVGARLLTLIYSTSDESQQELARETLGELRAVINDLESKRYSCGFALSKFRMEAAQRCKTHGVILKWGQVDETTNEYLLETRQYANLKRILREVVTNALRHSDAKTLHVDVQMKVMELVIQVSNDKVHFGIDQPYKAGRGMHNIRSRAEELGGRVEWKTGKDSLLRGYTVCIEIPLQEEQLIDE